MRPDVSAWSSRSADQRAMGPIGLAGARGEEEPVPEMSPGPAPLFHDEGAGYDLFGLQLRALKRALSVGRPLYQHYFRVESHGIENIPAAGPAILVSNHGGVLPVDGAMLWLDILLRSEPIRIPRPIVDRFVPGLPVVGTHLARLGAVSGTRANARRLLERGELLVIWPEGTTGVAKPFRRRYRLQEWRVGHAELAIRHRAPVVPVAVVGAEESWPLLGRVGAAHLFGLPYLPIPAVPFPLPAHYRIEYGRPLLLHRDYPAEAADDPAVPDEAAWRVRADVQDLIRHTLRRRRSVFR